jgi:hypothetical protein
MTVPDEKPLGFVALKSLKQGPPDAETALAELRRIYFRTTRQTIEHDLAHAIALLKSLPDEETREKAAVFMDGLAQMRTEWAAAARRKSAPGKGVPGKSARAKGVPGRGASAQKRR